MPSCPLNAPWCVLITCSFLVIAVADVHAGRLEQDTMKPGEEVVFMSLRTASAFAVVFRHQHVDQACSSDNVGLITVGLDKNNVPRSGDGVEQGIMKSGEEVVCLPTHRASDPCTWQGVHG